MANTVGFGVRQNGARDAEKIAYMDFTPIPTPHSGPLVAGLAGMRPRLYALIPQQHSNLGRQNTFKSVKGVKCLSNVHWPKASIWTKFPRSTNFVLSSEEGCAALM